MRTSSNLYFSEHCIECGAQFTIDALEYLSDRFRLHIGIVNTGEHGTLTLLLDGSRVHALDAAQADQWVQDYPRLRVQNRVGLAAYQATEAIFSIHPIDEHIFPNQLEPGASWDGWFESTRPIPNGSVGLLAVIGLFREELPDRLMAHILHDATHPFITLTGPEVTVAPLTGLSAWTLNAAAWLRAQFNIYNLGLFTGAGLGAVLDVLTLGVGVIGWLIGALAGHTLARRYLTAKYSRPSVKSPVNP